MDSFIVQTCFKTVFLVVVFGKLAIFENSHFVVNCTEITNEQKNQMQSNTKCIERRYSYAQSPYSFSDT